MPPKRLSKPNQSPKKQQENKKVEEPMVPEQKQDSILKQPQEEALQEQLDEQGLRKQKQVDRFKQYVEQNGFAMAFQVIFAEILDKKIEQRKVFQYTAMRLRQIGQDLQKLKLGKK